jgi:lipid-A-disaccharide synthase
MRAYVDRVLAILPFEPAVHVKLGGPPCIYVGHPLVERINELRPNADEARRRRADPPVLLALPGSRSNEIRRLLGIFGAAIDRVAARVGPIEVVLPTVPHLLPKIREGISGWTITPRVIVAPAEKWAAFRRARVALAASGTVTLELALAGVPMVAAYRLHAIEAIIARLIRLQAKLPSVILANLVIGENVVPELLQEDCTPEQLADALVPLFSDTPERFRQVEAFQRLDRIMAIDDVSASAKVADIVLDVARHGRDEAAMAVLPR